MIYNNVLELIGNTPLMRVDNFKNENGITGNEMLLKLEMFNPGGSIKDRAAYEMITSALLKKKINKDTLIIEPTSGNTGIGLAVVCNCLKLKLIIVMPSNMSVERINLLKAYNAEVILTDAALGMKGSIEKANEIAEKNENSFIPMQFSNEDNYTAHIKTTANEIISDTDGKIDYLVACIGTGGTITGLAKKLKESNKDIKIIGVEPEESPLISKGVSGPHKIQGIGANFIPEILDLNIIDKVLTVSSSEAYKTVNNLVETEGLLVGISGGACVAAAAKLIKEEGLTEKTIVCIIPDSGERYLSTDLFDKRYE